MEDRLADIAKEVIQFRDERDWKQFHDPKNLSEAICVESAELLEKLLWKTPEETKSLNQTELNGVREEIADIMIFLIYLCDAFNLDLLDAVASKLEVNKAKYPKEKARGTSKKYTEL